MAAREHLVNTAKRLVECAHSIELVVGSKLTRLWLSLKSSLKCRKEFHLEGINGMKEIRVDYSALVSTCFAFADSATQRSFGRNHTEHLVRLAETKSHLILVHKLAVLLGTFGPHLEW